MTMKIEVSTAIAKMRNVFIFDFVAKRNQIFRSFLRFLIIDQPYKFFLLLLLSFFRNVTRVEV